MRYDNFVNVVWLRDIAVAARRADPRQGRELRRGRPRNLGPTLGQSPPLALPVGAVIRAIVTWCHRVPLDQ